MFQAAPLEGTNITLNGATAKRILVSDAVPFGTVLSSVSTALPSGWTAVYSTSTGLDPLDPTFEWFTVRPAGVITRVGFVRSGTIGATGTTTTGLRFTVVSSGVASTGGIVENIAQVFGQTVGDPSPTPQVIYDESGDQNPNNFNDDDSLPDAGGDASGSEYIPGTDTGIADSANEGIDTNNNNTGIGEGGEVNVIRLTPTTDDILNGTRNTPNAIGPTSDNDDFTNQSTPTPAAGTDPAATFDPLAVTFENSLSNPAGAGFIAETTIEPIAPSAAEAAGGVAGAYGANTDIPDGTEVTITAGGNSATYTYDSVNGFVINAGDTPVNVGDVIAGTEVDYQVVVNLPAGTAQLQKVSIPIIAFPDDDPAGTPGYTGETTNNITIDRLYTGFISLLKEARVLQPDGSLKLANPNDPASGADFSITPLQAAPGEFIEYRIRYENISESAAGAAGSIDLTAGSFSILEDGTTAPNNWADFTAHQQNTVASDGIVEYYTNSGDPTPASTTDPASGTTVQEYQNDVGSVAPSDTGEFTFRRLVD